MSDASGQPPNTIAQVGEMPVAAPRPRDWRGLVRVLGGIAALAVIVAAAFFIHALLNPPPANDPVRGKAILSRAEAANPQDMTFTVAGTVGATVAGAGFSTPLNGSGQVTRQPQRLHLALSAQSPLGGALTVEVIEDATTYYLKTAGLGSTDPNQPWTKTTTSPGDGIGGIAFTQFLDYRYIQNPIYVGDETIAGHATYHIHADLSSQINGAVATATPTGTSAKVTEDLWFNKSNYYPVQIVLHAGGDAQANTTAIAAKADETFTFTAWNTGVTIALPSPDQVQ
ncbi:MAG: hypothetical protein H0X24_13075 [Ktedonobacterales bacterium]|nr:hypothetical protein [Ktedonobacterales bacterium]